jgi:two-component system NtrC family sensor kinase
VSGVTPVYVGDQHVANIGTDDILDDLEASIRRSDITGASHSVFRGDGRLIIDPSYMDRIAAAFDGVFIGDTGDPRLGALLRLSTQSRKLPRAGLAAEIDAYYAISQFPSNGWYFASTLPGSLIRAEAFREAQWVLWTGLASLALLLMSMAFILRRQIGQPLQQLLGGIQGVTAGAVPALPLTSSEDEFGHLALAFNEMARKVWERDTAVSAERERFRALIEQGADIISVVDDEGIVRYVSPSIERVLGYPQGHYAGRPIYDIVHPDDAPILRASFEAALRQPGVPIPTPEYRRQHRDGTWHWFVAIGTNQMDNPAVRGIVVNARDITEAKRSAEELQRQRESIHQREKLAAMGSLLAGVAHELNNPLSIVVGRAIMLEEAASDPANRSATLKLRDAAERCARIVRTFLAMARQRTPERGPVKIEGVLAACVEMLGYSLRTSGIHVRVEGADGLPEILADGDQLHQVFVNLLVNAQQALSGQAEPRRITVNCGKDEAGNHVWVEVADNGPGVPLEIRSRVFEPYFTTKPMGVGTGVGLAVSLGIVEAHGGSMELRCPVAGGAVFRVQLPVAGCPEGPKGAAAPRVENRCQAACILVVDDEPEVAALLADIVGEFGEVEVALGGVEAIHCLERHSQRFDAVISDLRMPEVDGITLYREICARWPRLATRVILVTGDSLSPDLHEFLESSCCPVMEKPFIPAEVRQKVGQICARPA